eukprot:13886685-Alexandrium_andersonii.AAC.1
MRIHSTPDPARCPKPFANAWDACLRDQDSAGSLQDIQVLIERGAQLHRVVLAVKLEAQRARKRATDASAKALAKKRQEASARFADHKSGLAMAFRALRRPPLPPLTCLQDQAGALIVHPDSLEREMQRQWSPIFQGNGDPIEVASKFVAEYKQFLPSHAPFEVPSITPKM